MDPVLEEGNHHHPSLPVQRHCLWLQHNVAEVCQLWQHHSRAWALTNYLSDLTPSPLILQEAMSVGLRRFFDVLVQLSSVEVSIPTIYSVDGNCFPLTVCQANRKASSMASLLPYWVFALATVRAALWLACWYSCSMYSKPVSVTRDQTPTSFLFCLTYDCCVVECTIRQVLHHLFECRKS